MYPSPSSYARYSRFCLFVLLSLCLSACGRPDSLSSQSRPAQTAPDQSQVVADSASQERLSEQTPLAVSATPSSEPTPSVEATQTAAPASPTPLVPTPPDTLASQSPLDAAAIEAAITEAVQRADDAQMYQMEQRLEERSTLSGREPFESLGAVEGKINGNDRYFVTREQYGKGHHDGNEYLRVGDTVYYRRVPGTGFTTSGQWYKHPYQERGFNALLLELPTRLTLYTKNAPFGSLRDDGHITLDNQSCRRFVGDGDVALAAYRALDTVFTAGREALEPHEGTTVVLDQADVVVTICDDGYLHDYSMSMAGQITREDIKVFSTRFSLHLWNFDTPIVLTPPPDAIDGPAQ